MSSGGEPALVRDHFAKQTNIFSCGAWSVFTDTDDLAPVPVTNIGSLKSKMCYWGSWCNTRVFLRAWDAVFKEGKYSRKAWTLKVDADSVFLPDRLQWHVKDISAADPWYLKNGNMLLGAMEVFSNAAVRTLAEKRHVVCIYGIDSSGEDGFIDNCMQKLKVSMKMDWNLLRSTRNPQECGDGSAVAFHPFKDVGSFIACQGVMTR